MAIKTIKEFEKTFMESQKTYAKNRTYQKITDNCELLATQNIFVNDEGSILIKTIIYDALGNIYDTLFSWDFKLLFDLLEGMDEKEKDESIIKCLEKVYLSQIEAFLTAYSLKEENVFLLDIFDLLTFSAEKSLSIPLGVIVSWNNYQDYFLLSKENIQIYNSKDKDFTNFFTLRDAIGIDEETPIFTICLGNGLIDKTYWFLEENTSEENDMVDVNILNNTVKANSDIILQMWKIKDFKKDEVLWNGIYKSFLPIDNLTKETDIALLVLIKNKDGFASQYEGYITTNVVNSYIFRKYEDLKEKIRDILYDVDTMYKHTLIYEEDDDEFDLKDGIFFPKNFTDEKKVAPKKSNKKKPL